jgi:hypothetical protein
VRTVSTIALLAGFFAFIYSGHVPLMFLVLAMQVGSTRCSVWCLFRWTEWHVPRRGGMDGRLPVCLCGLC